MIYKKISTQGKEQHLIRGMNSCYQSLKVGKITSSLKDRKSFSEEAEWELCLEVWLEFHLAAMRQGDCRKKDIAKVQGWEWKRYECMNSLFVYSTNKHKDKPLDSCYAEGYKDEKSNLCLRGSSRG